MTAGDLSGSGPRAGAWIAGFVLLALTGISEVRLPSPPRRGTVLSALSALVDLGCALVSANHEVDQCVQFFLTIVGTVISHNAYELANFSIIIPSTGQMVGSSSSAELKGLGTELSQELQSDARIKPQFIIDRGDAGRLRGGCRTVPLTGRPPREAPQLVDHRNLG